MKYELLESQRTVDDMFLTGLKFYKTHKENVFLSNYDAVNPSDKADKDLRKKNLVLVVKTSNPKNYTYISTMLLEDKKEVINIIDSL